MNDVDTCHDCGDSGDVIADAYYPTPLCPSCTARRQREGEDDAARIAYADAIRGRARRREVALW